MKKRLLLTGMLVGIDQIIKLLIANLAMDRMYIWIPKVLRFEPYQNTNLNWIASMLDFNTPVIFMILLQVLALTMVMLYFRHLIKKSEKVSPWLNGSFCFMVAGISCSFIDVVFWGGSLDYIGLFDWFIFDAKDVYLHCGWILLLIWTILQEKKSRENSP